MNAQVKIVIVLKEGKSSVGVQTPGCDPHISIVEGGIEPALEKVPSLVKQAQGKWAQSLLNPKTDIDTIPPSPPAQTTSSANATSKTTQPKDQPLFF